MKESECFFAELCATTAADYQKVWADYSAAETVAGVLAENYAQDATIAPIEEEVGAVAIDANVNRHELPGTMRRVAAKLEGGCGDRCTLVKLAQRLDEQN